MNARAAALAVLAVLAAGAVAGSIHLRREAERTIVEESKLAQVHGFHFMTTEQLVGYIAEHAADPWAASQAFRALSFAADPAAAAPVAVLLSKPGMESYTRGILRTLGNIGDPRSVGTVVPYLWSEDEDVARTARGVLNDMLGYDLASGFRSALEALKASPAAARPGCDALRQPKMPEAWTAAVAPGSPPRLRSALGRAAAALCGEHAASPIAGVPPVPELAAAREAERVLGGEGAGGQDGLRALEAMQEDAVGALGEVLARAKSGQLRQLAAALLARRPWAGQGGGGQPPRQAPDFVLARLRALARGFRDVDAPVRDAALRGALALIEQQKRELMMVNGYQRRRYLQGLRQLEPGLAAAGMGHPGLARSAGQSGHGGPPYSPGLRTGLARELREAGAEVERETR